MLLFDALAVLEAKVIQKNHLLHAIQNLAEQSVSLQ
jgi:hypothetical protein